MHFRSFAFEKFFSLYYLLAISMILLTVVIQSITQYSLRCQNTSAMVINTAGRQRMLSQKILAEFYSSRFDKGDPSILKKSLLQLYHMNTILQKGDAKLGIPSLQHEEIQESFRRLRPTIGWIYEELNNVENAKNLPVDVVESKISGFLEIMEHIVHQFQERAERDLRNLMAIELALAVLAVVIVLMEIFLIVNPIIADIRRQKRKLEEISWHQVHSFSSHMKNIKDLQYVLGIEKNVVRQQEIMRFISEELDGLEQTSKSMVNSLENNDL